MSIRQYSYCSTNPLSGNLTVYSFPGQDEVKSTNWNSTTQTTHLSSKKFHISFIPTPSVVLATRNTFSHFQHLVYMYTCISSSRLPALSSRTRQAPRYLSVIVSIHSQIRDSGRIAAEESLICIHPFIIQLPQGCGLLPRELFL